MSQLSPAMEAMIAQSMQLEDKIVQLEQAPEFAALMAEVETMVKTKQSKKRDARKSK